MAPTKTAAAESTGDEPVATKTPEGGPSSTQSEPTYAPVDQTALALGVGGAETDPPDTNVNAASTEPAATEAPVIDPPDATETPPPTEAADAPTEAAAEPTVAPTEPTESVMPAGEPTEAAAASAGALDYEITDLQVGDSLPDLTLGPLQNEEWVVVTLDVKNAGSDVANLDMADFTLKTAEGDEFALDSATGAVATYLGLADNNGAKDTREIGPGERTSVVLVFVPPANASGLTLEAAGASLPLEKGAAGQATVNQPQSSSEQTADEVSPQLLTTTFEQFDILQPDRDLQCQDRAAGRQPLGIGCGMSGTFRVAPAIEFGYGVSGKTGSWCARSEFPGCRW